MLFSRIFNAGCLILAASVLLSSCNSLCWKNATGLIEDDGLVMRVLTVDEPEDSLFLRQSCRNIPVKEIGGASYRKLAGKLVATVSSPEQDGVGIAGPQVGVGFRVVAVQRFDKEGEPFEVYPNIRITAVRGEKKYGPEGCLSVPEVRGDVARYQDIDITYTSPATLKDTTERIQGFTAVIFQHECDHLDGVLYTDKLALLDDSSENFVLITDVIPDAMLDMRYYGSFNFIGDRIPGYEQPVAILSRQATDSLKLVCDDLRALGYIVRIYDAYRPQCAVDYFMAWAEDVNDVRTKQYFYPELEKGILVPQEYVARHSSHTRGSTVDLTLFDMASGKEVDMGCTFDYFGVASHPDVLPGQKVGAYKPINEEQYRNRMILREAMLSHGFNPYDCEWWHFTLADEPFPNSYFNFPVSAKSL